MRGSAWIVGSLCFAVAASASALPYAFMAITDNDSSSGGSPTNPQIGEAQLLVNVLDPGSRQVLFLFTNTGPDASSITDIYFDVGSLFAIASINDADPGVDFDYGAKPAHLPGGRNLPNAFEAILAFNTSSVPPSEPNGVNPGEWLEILFTLQSGMTFSDVLAELGDGSLRIGLKVGGFADDGSESFVNLPQPVPELSTGLSLSIFGLVGLAFSRRYRTP